MATPCIPQLGFRFQGLAKPIVASFDVPHASSEGGAVLLKAVDDKLGLTERLAACLVVSRLMWKMPRRTFRCGGDVAA